MYQLTAKTGPYKGLAWPLSEKPIVIGRDFNCDIAVNDPIVSRRHCEVVLTVQGVGIRDLGSSNATFVNGENVKSSALRVGDEVAVGNCVFLVARVNEPLATPPDSRPSDATSSMHVSSPIYLYEDSDTLLARGKPRTAGDFAELFQLARALSQAATLEGVVTSLLQHATERFRPSALWVALFDAEGDDFRVLPQGNAQALLGTAPLLEALHKMRRTPRGVLWPDHVTHEAIRVIRTTALAPIVLSGETVGALVIQGETPARLYDEADLEFLLAMSHTAAPYLKAVERLEQLERENERLAAGVPPHGAILGTSRAIAKVRTLARQCARANVGVLLLGETGTGKELAARLIHELSDRASRPLTVVNCAAIPEELFESEVFGYERGAFTGAQNRKIGLFEESDKGTLFLDEVGDLSPANQARLLRAIETGGFRRLGGQSDIRVDVRIIAATNKDLNAEVTAGRFRRDLYHRLNAFEIHLPPLRERRSDIPLLAQSFLANAAVRFQKSITGIDPEALKILERQHWAGNIRELRNAVERAVVVAKYDRVLPEDLNLQAGPADGAAGFMTLAEIEKEHILRAIQYADRNISAAASLLGIGRSTLYRKLEEYGLPQE